MTGKQRRDNPAFRRQFNEVMQDVAMDMGVTLFDVDHTVARRVWDATLELMKTGGDVELALRNLMSGMLWMFVAGREHALRGYADPVPRADTVGDGWVPDTVAELLRGEGDKG